MNATPLPVELYVAILTAIPTSKADPSERTLLNCVQAHSFLRAAAYSSAVWKAPYHVRYTHSDVSREWQRRSSLGENWRELYIARRRRDREALALVDKIRTERAGRHTLARRIVREYGFDVWDALREETMLPLPAWLSGEPVPPRLPDALPRRYWAQTVLGVIARRETMDVFWKATVPDQQTVDFVTGLTSLSAFFDVSPQEVNEELEQVCNACIEKLIAKGVPLDPTTAGYDFWELCQKIREVIHELGFQVAEGSDFYMALNQFPHFFLKPENRKTIPMSLVFVFVAVARKLGIEASPANFPGVVQAHIQPPNGEPFKLLDMRGNQPPAALSSLPFAPFGLPTLPDENSVVFRAASTATMLSRSCNNIRAFIHQRMALNIPLLQDVVQRATYTISCWLFLLQDPHMAIPSPPESKTLDYGAVLLDGVCSKFPLLDLTGPATAALYESHIETEEQEARVIKTRPISPDVQYFVGLPLIHKKYHYAAVIYDWDYKCMASERWIETMHVDQMQYGRNQPFYRVLPLKGQSCYVAQENIIPAPATYWDWRDFNLGHPLFARYFNNMELDPTTKQVRLKASQELLDAYPEDDAFGAEWLRTAHANVMDSA